MHIGDVFCCILLDVSKMAGGSQDVTFSIQSDCEKIRGLGEKLKAVEPIDSYIEIHPGGPGIVMNTVRETLLGCCAGCAVPVGIFKGMQVAAGLALPRSIAIKIESGA